MFDFRLKVFYTVAKRLSFSRAAEELFITQPAVTRHIRELESIFKLSLFERSGNRQVVLTAGGQNLLLYAEQLLSIYHDMEYDMNLLVQNHKGVLRIGASTTIAQYVIPPLLAQFHQKFGEVQITLRTANTEDIEQALVNKQIELGIIEGLGRNPQIKYDDLLKDEIVLVCKTANKMLKKETITPGELKNYPLLLREPGSGTLEVIAHALKPFNIKLSDLKIEMQLDSTEAIKSYLLHSNCLAFISVYAILKELKNNECKIIDVKDFAINRPFNFINLHGHISPLAELFMRFAHNYNLK